MIVIDILAIIGLFGWVALAISNILDTYQERKELKRLYKKNNTTLL